MAAAVEVKKILMTIVEVSFAHISDTTPDEVQAYLTQRASRILETDTDAVGFHSDVRGTYDFGFCYARHRVMAESETS